MRCSTAKVGRGLALPRPTVIRSMSGFKSTESDFSSGIAIWLQAAAAATMGPIIDSLAAKKYAIY